MKIHHARDLGLEVSINRDAEIKAAHHPARLAWVFLPIGVLVLPALFFGRFVFLAAPDAVPGHAAGAAAPSGLPVSASRLDHALPSGGAFSAAGYVEPIPPFPIKISPLVPGRIDEFVFLEGDPVRSGEVIARLNADHLHHLARELRATLDAHVSRVEFAEKELARAESLAARGAATTREHDQAFAEAKILRAEVAKIRAEMETVNWQIEQSVVRSPIDGILYERLAQEGEYINLDERHEIASVLDPTKLRVWVEVNQREATRLAVGGEAIITWDAEPGLALPATLDRILPRASQARNTIRAILTLQDSSPSLRPDMSVKVNFKAP